MRNRHYQKLAMLLLLVPGITQAVDFSWNGFGSIGISGLDLNRDSGKSNIPFSNHTEKFDDSQDSRFALQGNAWFNDRFSATLQLIAHGHNDYQPEVEWAYLSWQANNNLKFRVGKLRKPLFAYSDHYDLGYAYQWIRPPSSVYFDFGPFFSTIDTVDFYYQKMLGSWSYSAQAYIGSKEGHNMIGTLPYEYNEQRTYGLVNTLEKQDTTLFLGLHESVFDMKFHELDQLAGALSALGYADLAQPIPIDDKVTSFIDVGIVHSFGNWGINAELIMADPRNSLMPDIRSWYTSINRRFGAFTLHYTLGRQKAIVNDGLLVPIDETTNELKASTDQGLVNLGSQLGQISGELGGLLETTRVDRTAHAAGVRFDFMENAAVKLEYEYIDNALGGDSSLIGLSLDFLF